jgi:hypothetical protein
MSTMNAKMQKAMVDVELLDGEEVLHAWQADGFYLGTNPAAKALAILMSFLVKLTGGHIRIFLVVTNMRIFLVESRAIWCGCQRVRGVNAISLSSVKEAGTGKETQWCCINSRAIHIESMTQRYTMIVRKFSDQDLKGFLKAMSTVIIQNAKTL